MAGPRDVSGKVGPARVPAQQQPTEAQTTKAKKKISPQDAARLAQQAGFQKSNRKKGRFDLGDSSQAPIPLPEDELDPDAWSQQALESAQELLGGAAPQLEQASAELGEEMGLGQALVENMFMPTEKGLERLQALKEREPEPEPDLKAVSAGLEKLFGVRTEGASPHEIALAVGLVVAGQKEGISGAEGELDRAGLLEGVRKVTEKGNQAVGQAQKMNKGIDEQLNVQRTFMFRR
jgi:hypothetical protein|tara:strand:- start:1147 stop:1851 length:705 start_codon:yes stop_codon:yes gene_type:complete